MSVRNGKKCYSRLFLRHLQNLICKMMIIHENFENRLKQLDSNNAPDEKKKEKLSCYIFL